jgi:putative ABC transport system permease protein
MAEEMRQHIEELTKVNIREGMGPEAARFAALRRFGGVAQIKDRCREEHGFAWVDQISTDFRYALRSLRRSRGYTITILATLFLGIGVSTVVFNMSFRDLFHTLPYSHADRILQFGNTDNRNPPQYYIPFLQFEAYREQTDCFEKFALVERTSANVVVDSEPVATAIQGASIDCFSMFGVRVALGRGFVPEDFRKGVNDVVVISDMFWKQHFGGAKDVIGRRILIDRQACVVVGVLYAGQEFPRYITGDIFRPAEFAVDPDSPFLPMLLVFGRLKPGITQEQALGELSAAKLPKLPQWAADYVSQLKPILSPLNSLNLPASEKTYIHTSWLIFGAAAFLYATACLNTVNLILIRLLGRRRELKIRFAVGGSRWQVIRLLAIEGLLLSLGAVLLVTLAARWIFPPLFNAIYNSDTGRFSDYWDWGTLTCIATLGLVACLASMITPAFRLMGPGIISGLKDGGPTSGESQRAQGLRDLLVILQAAFAVILLVGTGLMVRSFEKLRHLDLGFDPVGKVVVQISMPHGRTLKPQGELQLYDRLRQRLSSLPGVRAASYGENSLFVGFYERSVQVRIPGGKFETAAASFVAGDYQKTAGLELTEGRWLSDKHGQIETVINESFAKAIFGSKDPVGQLFMTKVSGEQQYPVVGVIRDVRETARSPAGIRFYVPAWVFPPNINTVILRLDRDPPKEFYGLVRRAVYQVDPDLITDSVNSVDDAVGNSMWTERLAYTALKGLALIAFGLTVIGIFSVITYTVDSRMTEFGVRTALGARPFDLHCLVMGQGLKRICLGLAIGTFGAVGLSRFMESILFETTTYDPITFIGVSTILILAGLFACWLPARRAGKVDVVRLLKTD